MRPQSPVHPGVAVARRTAQGHATCRALGFQGLHQFQKACRVFGNFFEPRLLDHALAKVDEVAVVGHGNGDPFACWAFAVGLGGGHPAAIFFAQIRSHVAHVNDLAREQMRQRIKPPKHVGPLVRIGRDAGLGLHIVKGLVDDLDRYTSGLGKGFNQAHESVFFGLYKALPAQQLYGSAFFRFEG